MKDLMVPTKQTKTCDNCRGNGYLNVVDNQNLTQVKQCWVCESEGEIKNYDQVEVDNFIYGIWSSLNFSFRIMPVRTPL